MAIHSSILAPEINPMGTNLPGYSPWGHKESDITEWLNYNFSFKVMQMYSHRLLGRTNNMAQSCIKVG